jgi:hypothetical protein
VVKQCNITSFYHREDGVTRDGLSLELDIELLSIFALVLTIDVQTISFLNKLT